MGSVHPNSGSTPPAAPCGSRWRTSPPRPDAPPATGTDSSTTPSTVVSAAPAVGADGGSRTCTSPPSTGSPTPSSPPSQTSTPTGPTKPPAGWPSSATGSSGRWCSDAGRSGCEGDVGWDRPPAPGAPGVVAGEVRCGDRGDPERGVVVGT